MVCPECGAAWMKQRMTRPYWLRNARSRAEGGRAGTGWLVRFLTATPPPSQLLGPDDRGRFVSVVDSRLFLVAPERKQELGPERCGEIRRTLRKVGAVGRVLVALGPGAIAVVCWFSLIQMSGERETALKVVLFIGGALFTAVTVGLFLGHGFYSPRRAARVLAAEGLCASCLHALRGLTPEADGCVVCPECGGSWRAAVVASGTCPSCRYSLRGLPLDSDGRVRCPECGGTWKPSAEVEGQQPPPTMG
jgi:ssDNA-binding Zn-finger/Zn-ribbon topoisomerase 1